MTRRAAYLHVAGQLPERMGWLTADGRTDLPDRPEPEAEEDRE